MSLLCVHLLRSASGRIFALVVAGVQCVHSLWLWTQGLHFLWLALSMVYTKCDASISYWVWPYQVLIPVTPYRTPRFNLCPGRYWVCLTDDKKAYSIALHNHALWLQELLHNQGISRGYIFSIYAPNFHVWTWNELPPCFCPCYAIWNTIRSNVCLYPWRGNLIVPPVHALLITELDIILSWLCIF